MDRIEKRARINREIHVKEVRLVDAEGVQRGVMPYDEALRIAETAGLDLVEVAPTANPPVCRVMDYGKYKYEQNKKVQLAKKKQVVIQIKEVKFRPKTDEHDYQFKLRHIRRFLEEKDKVKVTIHFRGREIAFSAPGINLLNRIRAEIEDIGTVESEARMEGRNMIMLIAPKN